jgi:hypothetical protein
MTQSDDVRYLETLIARLRAWWRRRRGSQAEQKESNGQSSE